MEKKDANKKVRIAAIGDIHIHEKFTNGYPNLFEEINERADYLALCGDLTQRGEENEADILADMLAGCKIPILAVLGNHDYESGKKDKIISILSNKKVHILDGEEPVVMNNVGFAGVKGFCGGFDAYMLQLWGESVIKQFYYEGVNEAQKLENALAKLQTPIKVVLLHYSPIKQTIIGESPEIFTYLGSSRLEDPINKFSVSAVFHGHAHHGTPEGKTSSGIPVYNVSYPLIEHQNPSRPYALIDL